MKKHRYTKTILMPIIVAAAGVMSPGCAVLDADEPGSGGSGYEGHIQAFAPPTPSHGAYSVRTVAPGEVELGPHARAYGSDRQNPDKNIPAEVGFEGYGFDDNALENDSLFIPPNPMGAAGPERVIAVGNALIEARTMTGELLYRDGLLDFFAPLSPVVFPFDPKIVYDHFAGRFLVVGLERVDAGNNPDPGNGSRILLAVSKNEVPASATAADWHFAAIDSGMTNFGLDAWADFPGFEVDEEAVYVTANLFSHPPALPIFIGVRLWIVDKGAGTGGLYDGGPASVSEHDPYAAAGYPATTMPCQIFGAAGAGPGTGTYLVSYDGLNNGTNEFVQVVRVDDPLSAVSFVHEFVDIGHIDALSGPLPDAPQNGSMVGIEVNDRRVLDCVWRDDRIWLTTTIEADGGADLGETTAHWLALDTSPVPGPISVFDQGNIGGEDIAPGTYTFFPSVAVNGTGTAKFGFSASAPSISPGAYVTGRNSGDSPGTVRSSRIVHEGRDSYVRTFGGPSNRWGDYSGIALDPIDDSQFWVFNAYAEERGSAFLGEDGRWGTAWVVSSDNATRDPQCTMPGCVK